jgi:hypothetical protein
MLLSAAWIVLSPHLFPWYIAAPLPFVALCLRLPIRADIGSASAFGLWLFALVVPFTYVIFAPQHNPNLFIWFFLIPAMVALSPLFARAIIMFSKWRNKHNSPPPASLTPPSAALAAAQKE